eukprot:TRINITY_DN5865_c0_g1_i15.p1 TRINITY_DN5865_c0_g1~~TRINITY_DN5865_c0_g1_i15.p1  ORF type:complete len:741 (+),score=169.13 TRINITY_DN5865_c0_g1_i15:940-3162(+)
MLQSGLMSAVVTQDSKTLTTKNNTSVFDVDRPLPAHELLCGGTVELRQGWSQNVSTCGEGPTLVVDLAWELFYPSGKQVSEWFRAHTSESEAESILKKALKKPKGLKVTLPHLVKELCIQNLPDDITENQLSERLSKYSPAKIHLVAEKKLAFVKFDTAGASTAALRALKGWGFEAEAARNAKSRSEKVINSLSEDSARTYMFELRAKDREKPEMISVYEYYKQMDTRLRHPDLPLLLSRRKNRATGELILDAFPMELAFFLPGQLYGAKSPRLQAELVAKTAITASAREQKLRNVARELKDTVQESMREWGVLITDTQRKITAYLLPVPELQYCHPHTNTTIVVEAQTRIAGVWNMRNKGWFEITLGLTHWAVVDFTGTGSKQQLQSWIDDLRRGFRNSGVESEKPYYWPAHGVNTWDPEAICDLLMDAAMVASQDTSRDRQRPFILCLLPDEGTALYENIKYAAHVLLPPKANSHTLPVQCIVKPKLASKLRDQGYVANIAAKVNLHLGGANTSLKSPGIPTADLMVIGIHVSNSDGVAVAAVLGSRDKYMNYYTNAMTVQRDPKEFHVQDLRESLCKLLDEYCEQNTRMPASILVYRDSVPDGQVAGVKALELDELRAAAASRGISSLGITYILVSHDSVRVFPEAGKGLDEKGNPKAGLVADKGVCDDERMQFRLQPHATTKGTPRMHCYTILENDSHSMEALSTISFQLCFLFGRCTRAVSKVTPLYYAHDAGVL